MTTSPEPTVASRPTPGRALVFGLLVLIDVGAVMSLIALLYDELSYQIDGSFLICAVLLVAAIGFVVGAIAMMRRGRFVLATALATVPAVPAILATAAVLFFIATFHHSQ